MDDSMLATTDLAADDPERFKLAKGGDHLMCPFQCDGCNFQNLKKRAPGASDTDGVLLLCIRSAHLDALWAREPATVHSNRREGVRVLELSKQLGLENPYPRRGPYPVKDSFGMGVAAMMLMRSLDTGKNARTIQYETMRKLRGHYSNFVHTTPDGVGASTTSSEGASSFVWHSETNGYCSNGSCTVATSAWVTCGFRIDRSPWKNCCAFRHCWKKTGGFAV